MMINNHAGKSATLAACIAACAFLAPLGVIPAASAADAVASDTVASARAFPAYKSTKRITVGVESTSTDSNGDWGDVESLNVPQTQSQAEKDAAAEQAQAAQAAQAAADSATKAASRSASRTAVAANDVPVSGNATDLVAFALQFQGAPYVYGGTTPDGWDCSGFTQYVFAHFGISLPRIAADQGSAGTLVTDPQPGDLMISATHAGIYIGNGLMIHAMTPAQGTQVTAVMSGMSYYRVLK